MNIAKKNKKEEFKRRLSGELIDWKEFALYQIHRLCQAENREKDFCPDSRYFYNAERRDNEEMKLTEEQEDYVGNTYIEWLREKNKL